MEEHDGKTDLREFGNSKGGVKWQVDAGIAKVPQFFVDTTNDNPDFKHVKGIDDAATRAEIVFKVKEACKQWGVFQIVNHDLPARIMKEMIEGVQKFHELDIDVKKQYYADDITRPFQHTNFLKFTEPAALGEILPCVWWLLTRQIHKNFLTF